MKPGTGNGKGTEAICPACGKKFRRKHKGQVFCNRACSGNGRQTWNSRLEYAAKAKKEKKKYFCTQCGKEYKPRYGGCKYCSTECKNEAKKIREQKIMEEIIAAGRTCVVCGKHFIPKDTKQRVCSDECRQNQSAEVMIRILEPAAGLEPDMQPETGKIYRAKRFLNCNENNPFWVVPGFGKYGVILRVGEAEEVRDTKDNSP